VIGVRQKPATDFDDEVDAPEFVVSGFSRTYISRATVVRLKAGPTYEKSDRRGRRVTGRIGAQLAGERHDIESLRLSRLARDELAESRYDSDAYRGMTRTHASDCGGHDCHLLRRNRSGDAADRQLIEQFTIRAHHASDSLGREFAVRGAPVGRWHRVVRHRETSPPEVHVANKGETLR
jgi:hypothetical protein